MDLRYVMPPQITNYFLRHNYHDLSPTSVTSFCIFPMVILLCFLFLQQNWSVLRCQYHNKMTQKNKKLNRPQTLWVCHSPTLLHEHCVTQLPARTCSFHAVLTLAGHTVLAFLCPDRVEDTQLFSILWYILSSSPTALLSLNTFCDAAQLFHLSLESCYLIRSPSKHTTFISVYL